MWRGESGFQVPKIARVIREKRLTRYLIFFNPLCCNIFYVIYTYLHLHRFKSAQHMSLTQFINVLQSSQDHTRSFLAPIFGLQNQILNVQNRTLYASTLVFCWNWLYFLIVWGPKPQNQSLFSPFKYIFLMTLLKPNMWKKHWSGNPSLWNKLDFYV